MGNSCSSRSNRVVDIQVARQHNVTSNSPVASHGSHRSLSLQQEDSGGSHTSSSHRDAERNNVGTSIQSLQGHVKLVGEFTAPIVTIDRALSAFSIRSFYDKRNEKITTDRATSAIKFSTGSSEKLQHTSTDEPITNSANKGDGYPENSFEMVIRLMRELENVIESMGGTGHGFSMYELHHLAYMPRLFPSLYSRIFIEMKFHCSTHESMY